MCLDDLTAEIEAKPGSLHRCAAEGPLALDAEELFEYPVPELLRNPGTAVRHGNSQQVPGG